jgi:lipopolysaccharide/colanic/teichoic acid biosynthesis glycosyltransferase
MVNYPVSARLSGRTTESAMTAEVGSRPLKRAFDVAAAAVLLVLLSPVFLLIVLLVRVTSPGPALFRQTRLGRGERTFTMVKFRTMYVNCSDELHQEYVRGLLSGQTATDGDSASGELFKLADDPRVTRLGSFLRGTSLDELPQLINVLRGDMSIVGPRPVLAFEAEMFRGEQRQRFAVRPGLTGLWQVSGRSRISFLDQLAIDARYVREQSFWLDVKILLLTVPTLLSRRTR